jgi:uncharacterized membrane protein
MTRIVSERRSLVKALTYRILIMCLDFGTIYVLSGTGRIALSFMIASNVYTSVTYFFMNAHGHESSGGSRNPKRSRAQRTTALLRRAANVMNSSRFQRDIGSTL